MIVAATARAKPRRSECDITPLGANSTALLGFARRARRPPEDDSDLAALGTGSTRRLDMNASLPNFYDPFICRYFGS